MCFCWSPLRQDQLVVLHPPPGGDAREEDSDGREVDAPREERLASPNLLSEQDGPRLLHQEVRSCEDEHRQKGCKHHPQRRLPRGLPRTSSELEPWSVVDLGDHGDGDERSPRQSCHRHDGDCARQHVPAEGNHNHLERRKLRKRVLHDDLCHNREHEGDSEEHEVLGERHPDGLPERLVFGNLRAVDAAHDRDDRRHGDPDEEYGLGGQLDRTTELNVEHYLGPVGTERVDRADSHEAGSPQQKRHEAATAEGRQEAGDEQRTRDESREHRGLRRDLVAPDEVAENDEREQCHRSEENPPEEDEVVPHTCEV